MALDDVKHVEIVAILNQLIENPHQLEVWTPAIKGWLEENHPPPTAYMAAMQSMVRVEGEEG